MASPQKENGSTQIANEILEKLIASNLNGTEIAACLLIIRKTYGWNKTEDEISLNQFVLAIPATKPTLCTALRNLQLVKVIKLVKKGNSKKKANCWAFNKNYDEWQLVKKSKLVKKINSQLVKKPLLTKDNKKQKKEKNTTYSKRKLLPVDVVKTPSQDMEEFLASAEIQDAVAHEFAAKYGTDLRFMRPTVQKFIGYWTERTRDGKKQLWETKLTFEYRRRLVTWLEKCKASDQGIPCRQSPGESLLDFVKREHRSSSN